jgi:Leucine-rich repeat (LRR) protein
VINFPDANFKAVLLAADVTNSIAYDCSQFSYHKIDTNSNGEIEQSEALAVCQLSIQNQNISDLTGIEYFTNLKNLGCQNNNLSIVNLSQLINLQTFVCDNNQFATIDLSGLDALKIFICKNNQSCVQLISATNLLFRVSIGLR